MYSNETAFVHRLLEKGWRQDGFIKWVNEMHLAKLCYYIVRCFYSKRKSTIRLNQEEPSGEHRQSLDSHCLFTLFWGSKDPQRSLLPLCGLRGRVQSTSRLEHFQQTIRILSFETETLQQRRMCHFFRLHVLFIYTRSWKARLPSCWEISVFRKQRGYVSTGVNPVNSTHFS